VKGKVAMQPISTLSGGEQVKVRLCILMLTKCNVLILDEPTNHIDVDSKEVLKEQLIN
jgi:ATPase subunit of ABC transporter with duplicated ATPase domains